MNDREPRNPDVSGRTNPLRGNPLGPPRALSGLDQLIGLALGAPEFQRR